MNSQENKTNRPRYEYDSDIPFAAMSIKDAYEMMRKAARAEIKSLIRDNATDSYPHIYDVKECAKVTGYAVNTLRKKVHLREIPYIKRDGKVLFVHEEVMNWLLENQMPISKDMMEQKDAILLNRELGL